LPAFSGSFRQACSLLDAETEYSPRSAKAALTNSKRFQKSTAAPIYGVTGFF
jgi:hypothetical protein